MKKGLYLLCFVFLAACGHLPDIRQPDLGRMPAGCDIFPQGRWQFVHSIEATPPDGSRQTMLGVLQLSPSDRTIRCVMLTVEGLVLFEAYYDGAVHIQRAVPPLDRPGLGEGLIRDLLLIFFAPEQPLTQSGQLENGDRICRFRLPDGGTQDIAIQPTGDWTLRRYNAWQRVTRTVHGESDGQGSSLGFPARLVLQAHGWLGYQLTMSLLEVEPLDD